MRLSKLHICLCLSLFQPYTKGIIMAKRYGMGNLLFDFIMTVITGGLWLIWVAVKFLRTH